MADFAKEIVVRQVIPATTEYQRKAGDVEIDVPVYVFEIDGVEFPWYVSDVGVRPEPATRNGIPGVTVTILAERVEFTHAIRGSE